MAHTRSWRGHGRPGDRLHTGCTVASVDTEIALAAVEACRAHGLASADAIVFATARENDADLLTCDRHFEGLPGVLLVPEF